MHGSLGCTIAVLCSRSSTDQIPKAKIRRRGQESLSALQELLHMRSLHMSSQEDLFAFPMLNQQQATWIILIDVKVNTMASAFVVYDSFDDRRELFTGESRLIRRDLAGDDYGGKIGVGSHVISSESGSSD